MVSSKFVRSKVARLLPMALAAFLLAGCPGRAPLTPPVNIQNVANADADYYLQQWQQSSDDNKTDWQLLAIRALLREGRTPAAVDLFNKLPQDLTAAQQQEQKLLQAGVLVAQHDENAAAALLAKLKTDSYSADQKLRYFTTLISATQNQPSLNLIRAYIAQQPLLTDAKARQENIDKTWQALVALPPSVLSSIAINANENTLQGWLDLLHTYQVNQKDEASLKAGIKDWQTRYPQNPAAKDLPTALRDLANTVPASTNNIALLLPVSDQAQVFANAIRMGFEAAKNGQIGSDTLSPTNTTPTATSTVPAQASTGIPVPSATSVPVTLTATGTDTATNTASVSGVNTPVAPNANQLVLPNADANAQVKVYDSSSQPIPNLLTQAKQAGATLVVGPLLKSNVEQLSSQPTTLNVLALNQPEKIEAQPNICYFALSPEDEARDAARHIWNQHKQLPLVLVPRDAFGDRVAKAFADQWYSMGGHTVLKQSFGDDTELKQLINRGTGIRLTGQLIPQDPNAANTLPTTETANNPSSVTIAGLTIPAPNDTPAVSPSAKTPEAGSGNGNIDAIYIVATQSQLTMLKPMIDMNSNYKTKPALYASSRSYQAGAGPDYRLEMEGVQFSDIPLFDGNNTALMQKISALMKNDYSLVRLYAMGVDAWNIANHFNEMRNNPGYKINGMTGVLSANSQCVIQRKLPWLEYHQGQLVPVN